MARCQSLAAATGKFWNQYKDELSIITKANPQLDAAMQAAKAADKMIQYWNTFFGPNSAARIGPRKLNLKGSHSGAVVAQRAFVASRPTKAPTTIVFEKRGGNKKKTNVKICTFNKQNRHKEVKDFTVTRDDPDGKTWKASVPSGVLVTVLIKGAAGTNTLKYTLRMKEASRPRVGRKKAPRASRKSAPRASRKKAPRVSRKKAPRGKRKAVRAR